MVLIQAYEGCVNMKYVVVLCDGMADYPVDQWGGQTPMTRANKPNMDSLAQQGAVGLVKTVPSGATSSPHR